MSSDDDKCFQWQETGHMTCYCSHIRCFDCDHYGHVAADCPNKIPPSGIPARCRDSNTSRHDRSTSQSKNHTRHYHHDHRDRHRFSRSQSCSHNPRYRSNSCSDSQRIHSRSFPLPLMPQHIMPQKLEHIPTTTETHHTADPHHTGVSPEMTVDPEKAHPTNTITKPQKRPSSSSHQTPWKSKDRKYKQVTIDDPPQSTIALMNRDSDSEDDLN